MNGTNDIPRSRQEAIASGSKLYCTGRICKYGHHSMRRVCNGTCIECTSIKANMYRGTYTNKQFPNLTGLKNVRIDTRDVPDTRVSAKELGSKYYYPGPCKNQHASVRYTSTGECVTCRKERTNTYNESLGSGELYRRYQKEYKQNKRKCNQ